MCSSHSIYLKYFQQIVVCANLGIMNVKKIIKYGFKCKSFQSKYNF